MINKAINMFQELPGVGNKSANRFAHFLLLNKEKIEPFIEALKELKATKHCQKCFNISEEDFCEICSNPKLNNKKICIVANVQDIDAFKEAMYDGTFHVLHGLIDPTQGKGPGNIKLKELFIRLKEEVTEDIELIIALGSSIEATATSLYLKSVLKPVGYKLTELAYGVSIGSDIQYADPMSISKSLENRREL